MLLYDIKNGQYDHAANDSDIWTKLNRAKSQLDGPFMRNPNTARTVINMLDPFGECKRRLSTVTSYAVSRAWMKCYELDIHFGLIRPDTRVWDNCAFPGMFIAAHNHISATLYQKPVDWVASSLYGSVESLPDTYGLYSNYRSKWLMNSHNDGNVCFSNNLRDFQRQLGRTISLYTSDLGIDVSNNYNDQESQHVAAHYGQSVAGLLTLMPGGDFVVKNFTFADPRTVSLIRRLVSLFAEFYICKPATSSIANSEVYFVGKRFLGITDRMCDDLLAPMPVEETRGGADTGADIVHGNIMFAATDIYTRQIKALQTYAAILNEYAALDLAIPRNKKIIRQAIDRTYHHAMGTSPDIALKKWNRLYAVAKINAQYEIVKPGRPIHERPAFTSRRNKPAMHASQSLSSLSSSLASLPSLSATTQAPQASHAPHAPATSR